MEILLPAGDISHINLAIQKNIDAVYGGFKNWNARNKASNFSLTQYNKIVSKLHENNIKFYLTLNVQITDDELDNIVSVLSSPNILAPDAFIVADIGLLIVLKEKFPNIPIHISTQFGLHNIEDIKLAKALGCTRAILARELTREEVLCIKNSDNIEIESFIWGSQCISFSGSCFLSSLLGGGSGNRGKCSLICRDLYEANKEKGNFFYVADMNCIELIKNLNFVDCIKIEGRRRYSEELSNTIDEIRMAKSTGQRVGYLWGLNCNNSFEKINSRQTSSLKISDFSSISKYDVFAKYKNGTPIKFSRNKNGKDVFYMYSEYNSPISSQKQNIYLELRGKDDFIFEIIYGNAKGNTKTFVENESYNSQKLSIRKLINDVKKNRPDLHIYKIKYKRSVSNKYFINKQLYNNLIQYIKQDVILEEKRIQNQRFKIKSIMIETQSQEIIDNYIDDAFVKIIYDIGSVYNFKKFNTVCEKYGNKIIYKLPFLNFSNFEMKIFYDLLQDKEVMFTRLSQLEASKEYSFKKKYTDYTIYSWNRSAINFLKNEFAVDEFTASPELSYPQNLKVFNTSKFQYILAGQPIVSYTRQCFKQIYNCKNCIANQADVKIIKNINKNIKLGITCYPDYRIVRSYRHILNDLSSCSKTESINNLRYITGFDNFDKIVKTIEVLRNEADYYSKLKQTEEWSDSIELNMAFGKD